MREARHQGEHVTLLPYLRGHYDRDFLHRLWTLIEADGDWPRIFWNNAYDETPVPRFGDLVDWVIFVEVGNRDFLVAVANDTHEIAGLVWFDKQTKETAFGNIWMARKYRGGGYARDTVRLGVEYALYAKGWKTLFTSSPWHMARNLVRRCGWKPLADLPEVNLVCGEPATVYYSKITSEDYEQWEKDQLRSSKVQLTLPPENKSATSKASSARRFAN